MAVFVWFMDFPLWLAPAVVFAALSAFIGMRRGYQPIPAFVIGMVLGPIAVIAYLVIPRTKEAQQQDDLEERINKEQSDAAKTRMCPKCHRILSVMARVCPKCESRF